MDLFVQSHSPGGLLPLLLLAVDSVVESKQTAIVCSVTQKLAVSPNRSKLKQKETIVHKRKNTNTWSTGQCYKISRVSPYPSCLVQNSKEIFTDGQQTYFVVRAFFPIGVCRVPHAHTLLFWIEMAKLMVCPH
jgi:hypothetical protein